MVEIVKRIVFFASEDPSGQSTSFANSGIIPQKIMRSRDMPNFEVIKVIVGKS